MQNRYLIFVLNFNYYSQNEKKPYFLIFYSKGTCTLISFLSDGCCVLQNYIHFEAIKRTHTYVKNINC